jgi:glycosyltransferase involved in cell wall biosynthesis
VAEALLQSSIVVCSKSVGAAEFLEHGVHAFIAETPAPSDLASAFQDALNRKEDWPSIQAAGKSLATASFTDRAFEKRFLEAIKDI